MKMRTTFLTIIFLQVFVALAQFPIGHQTITFNDPARTGGFGSGGGSGRQIQTEIYYPAVSNGNNTALATGEFPVIVFGHGFAMAWDAYQNIWEHYVPLGYILAFPRTEGGLIPGPSHGDFGLDIKIVTERMLAEDALSSSSFFQKINGNAGIMGHSMGGGATFLAAANNTTIKTVVGLAPAETNPSAIAAAVNITAPALIFSGGQDGVTPAAANHLPIYNGLASARKTFVNVVGGAHCYFANSNFNCDLGEGTSSSGISITRAEQQTRTFSLLDPWLDYTLKGNCDAYKIFVNALDDSPATLATQTTCVLNPVPSINDNAMVLTSSITGTSYQWYLNGNEILGATSQSYTASGNGDYTVEVFFPDECSEISLPYIISGLGVDSEVLFSFVLSPNPTNGDLFVKNSSGSTLEVRIYDQKGVLLSTQNVDQVIEMKNLSKGLYFVKIGNQTSRIVRN